MGKFIRDTAQSREQRLSPSRNKEVLIDKDRYIGQDKGDINKRDTAGWILVSKGDHLISQHKTGIRYAKTWNNI
jgi:hypothetical protein